MPRIALYLAIPRNREFLPIRRDAIVAGRLRLRRLWDELHWRAGDTGHVTRYAWERCSGSNKGDIGIREAILQQLRQAFRGQDLSITEIEWGRLDERTIERINREHDIFILGGSGYLALDAAGRLEERNARDILALENLRIPKIAYGIGLNYWLSELPGGYAVEDRGSIALLRRFLDGFAAIAVRDTNTARELGKLAGTAIRLIGDPALFLEPVGQPPPRSGTPRRIGLNLALHESGMLPVFQATLPKLVAFCRRMAAEQPVEFVYFVHAEVEYLVPRLLARHGISVKVVDTAPSEMLAFYASLDLHVSQMLHSAIFALAAGTPAINLAYDGKSLGFFHLLDLERFCLPAADCDTTTLLEHARSLLNDSDNIRQRIAARKNELKVERDRFLDEIVSIARHPGAQRISP